jgi:hypothetical protein
MKFSRLSLATLVALAAALTPFAAIPAHAQKPALTQNIDEKGRVPYHSSTGATCTTSCTLNFFPPPAGFRLVITYVSVRYALNPQGPNEMTLFGGSSNPGDFVAYNLFLPTPISEGFNLYVSSSPVTYYVEAAGVPSIGIASSQNGSTALGTISGYLVNLSQ